MWKTRFEVSTNNSNGLTRHRILSSSSSIIHHYYSRPLPTVPRVREDSPSAVVRPSPPSSIPNLEILTEEDEDIPCLNLPNTEQPSLLRKQTSYQTIHKHQIVLPTIIESHQNDEDFIDNQSNKTQDTFVATNINYNQVDIERKERIKTNEKINFTLDRRINELLQQKIQRQNQSIYSSTNIDKNEILTPTTFKNISAFFENKALTANTLEQKKIVRAKRILSVNRHIPINNNDSPKSEIISSTEEQSIGFHHQIKRIKKTHKSEFDSITKPEPINENSIAKESIHFKAIEYDNKSIVRILKRWFILLLLIMTMIIYLYLPNISKYPFRFNSLIHLQNYPFHFFSQQSKQPIRLINNHVIFRYGQFVRNRFFSFLDSLMTFIGQIFFRIDKYECKDNIIYVATSTYEHIYDWFIHLFQN